MKQSFSLRHLGALAAAAGAALLAACGSKVPLPPDANPAMPGPAGAAAARVAGNPAALKTSNAETPRAYRTDAAGHLYALNAPRIWKGKLPPLLYAIGTLEVEVDRQGAVRKLHWLRAPRHAPEVVAEIEKTVHAAAPFPVPARLGKVVYVDTWLWDKSGRFQLDTLSEGQE